MHWTLFMDYSIEKTPEKWNAILKTSPEFVQYRQYWFAYEQR